MDSEAKHVVVPHASLSVDALANLIDDFISRDGTDYGEREHSADEKRASVQKQLSKGTVLIVFDPESESVNLVRAEDLRAESHGPKEGR